MQRCDEGNAPGSTDQMGNPLNNRHQQTVDSHCQTSGLAFPFGPRISRPRPGYVTAAIALARCDRCRTKSNSSNGPLVDLRRPSAVVRPEGQERHQLLTHDRDVRKQCCRLVLVIAGTRRDKRLQMHLPLI